MNAFERKMINVIGEYGGIGYPVDGHLWKITETNWGYGEVMSSGDQVLYLYEKFADRLKVLKSTRIASPGSMQDTGCLGLVHWDDPEGWYGEGGGRGFRIGNTCTPMADSC